MTPPSDPSAPPPPRPKATLRQVFRAVAWGFFGVRGGKDMQDDSFSIRPHQLVLAGITMAVVFVLALLLMVRIIVTVSAA